MICFCKKCRVERKAAKEQAKRESAMKLPEYILSNYKRAADERKAIAQQALNNV